MAEQLSTCQIDLAVGFGRCPKPHYQIIDEIKRLIMIRYEGRVINIMHRGVLKSHPDYEVLILELDGGRSICDIPSVVMHWAITLHESMCERSSVAVDKGALDDHRR